MGCFTWTDATNAKKKVGYDGYAAVILPDSTRVETQYYDGYGHFGDRDAYDIVVDMNKDYLADIWGKKQDVSEELTSVVNAFVSGGEKAAQDYADSHFSETYYLRNEWKRCNRTG
jgi:hypothetical protein